MKNFESKPKGTSGPTPVPGDTPRSTEWIERSLYQVVERAYDCIIVVNGQGSIVFSNESTFRIFGYHPEELTGIALDTLIPARFHEQHHNELGNFAQTAEKFRPMGNDYRIVRGRHRNGQEFEAEIIVGKLNDDPQDHHYAAFIRDNSEQVQRNNELRESERKLKEILSIANAGIWEYDIRSRRTVWDENFILLTGIPRTRNSTGLRTALLAIHPADRRKAVNDLIRCVSTGAPFMFEIRVRKADGRFRWMLAKGFAECGPNGVPEKVIGFILDIHERKVYSDRLHQMLEASNSGVWEHDVESGEDYWDENVFRLLGYQPHEVPPNDASAHARMMPDDSVQVQKYMDAKLHSRDSDLDITYRIVLPNGNTRWIRDTGHIIRTSGGAPLKVIGTIQDVTEKKLLEERFNKILKASGAGAWEFDFQTGEGFWSDEDYAIYGYVNGEVSPSFEAVVNRLHPDDKAEFLRITTENIRNSNEIELTYRIVLPDGKTRWITDFGKIERDGHGQPVRMTGIAVDITNIKNAQHTVQAIYDSLPDGIIIADRQTNFLATNNKLLSMTGYTADEIKTMSVRDLHPIQEFDWIFQRFMDLAAGTIPIALDVPVLKKDGTIFHADISAAGINHNGEDCLIGYFHDATSRIAYEQQLRENKEQYERIVQTAQEGIWAIDRQGMTTFANRKICEMLECTEEEMIGRPFFDFMDEEGRRSAQQNLELKNLGFGHQHDIKFITRSGNELWTIISANPLTDAAGTVVGTLAMLTNITGRRKAERSIASAEAKFSAVFKTLPAEITIARLEDGVIIDANEEFFSNNRLTRSDLGNRTAVELGIISQQESDRLAAEIRTNGKLNGYEITSRRPDGLKIGLAYTELIELENLPHLLTISFDISERKSLLEKQLESEDRLRLITETIQEVFWMADPAINKMIYISPGYERVWGRTVQSLYDDPRSFIEAIHQDDRDRVFLVLKKQMDGITFDHQYRIIKPDGSIRWVRDQGFPVKNDAGELTYYVGVAQDITEKRQFDEQLMRSQRLESLGTIASGIAHDLNNILTPIMTGTSVLKYKLKGTDLSMFIETMEQSVNRGAEIIKQILTFARGVGNEQGPVDPGGIVRDLENMILQTFPKNITIRTSVETPPWRMIADSTQIHQVLMNLCVNSRDAMQAGGTLQVLVRNAVVDDGFALQVPDARAGNFVQFVVNDTGLGIPDEIRSKIFDPFFTTKEVGKGTGLGLFSTLSIIRNHGGFIDLRTDVGRGTSITVYIPADLSVNESTSVGTKIPFSDITGHGERILVIDDEKSIREIVESTLKNYGYSVSTASDGADALALYGSSLSGFDLVLSDIAMPILDGVATARVIKEIKPGMKIIMMTGLKTKHRETELKELGVISFIDKPFSAETVLTEIHHALHR